MSVFRYDDLIGKPYRAGAWGPEYFDCFGLLAEVYRRLGLECALPAKLQASVFGERSLLLSDLEADQWVEVKSPALLGDVALFPGPGSRKADVAEHAAVHVGGGRMLHVTNSHAAHTVSWTSLRAHALRVIRLAGREP